MAILYDFQTFKEGLESKNTWATAYIKNKFKGRKYPSPTPKQIRRESRDAAERAMREVEHI